MTTIDAAAAWRVKKPVLLAAFAAMIGLGLGGCETSNALFGNTTAQNGAPAIAGTDPAAAPAPAATRTAKIGIAPVIGAPEVIGKSLQTQLSSAIEAQRVSVAKETTDAAEFVVRGYVVSAVDKTRTRVSYIWDITDQSGKRVNRITGEEVVPGASKDPWSAVTPAVISSIATKTAGSLGAWLPTQNAAAVAQSPTPAAAVQPVAAAPTAVAPQMQQQAAAQPVQARPVAAQAPAPAAQQTAALPPQQAPQAGQQVATGSISRPTAAVVSGVTGAPGDGSVALSSALQRELQKGGLAMADQTTAASAYKVEGNVIVGQIQNGKQPIQIDWTLKDPTGKKLGSVSQKNEVPQGSLDGAWGRTADAAAAAAAQGLMKLIPQQTRTQ